MKQIDWVRSYVTDCTQVDKSHSQTSSPKGCLLGSPRLILGPLFFLLYLNNLVYHMTYGYCIIYADNISLFCKGKTAAEAQNRLQKYVVSAIKWLNTHKLVVNANKSKTMAIGSHQLTGSIKIQITINN